MINALTRINTCRHLVVDSTASSINPGPEAAAQSDLEQIKEETAMESAREEKAKQVAREEAERAAASELELRDTLTQIDALRTS